MYQLNCIQVIGYRNLPECNLWPLRVTNYRIALQGIFTPGKNLRSRGWPCDRLSHGDISRPNGKKPQRAIEKLINSQPTLTGWKKLASPIGYIKSETFMAIKFQPYPVTSLKYLKPLRGMVFIAQHGGRGDNNDVGVSRKTLPRKTFCFKAL
jgi:hypothetical protein